MSSGVLVGTAGPISVKRKRSVDEEVSGVGVRGGKIRTLLITKHIYIFF